MSKMIKICIYLTLLVATNMMASEVSRDASVTKKTINWAKDYNAGMIEAKKFDKPMLFIMSNKNCPPCTKLARDTLGDSRVIKALNKDFTSVIAYVSFTDSRKNDFVPRELNTGVTPTMWFLIPAHDIIYSPIKGPPTADMMLDMLKQVKAEADKTRVSKK